MKKPCHNTYWDGLIARYFDGTTTEEEERRLRRFLASPESAGRYDDVRAVVGFFAVGRQVHTHRLAKRRPFRPARHWVAAASLLLLLSGGSGWWIAEKRQNVCVAYIDGVRLTDPELVMQQAGHALAAVKRTDSEPTVEEQLTDMFQTLQDETNEAPGQTSKPTEP